MALRDALPSSRSTTARWGLAKEYWAPLLVLMLGACCILLSLVATSLRDRQMQVQVENLRVVGALRTEVSLAHLALENYVQGEPGADAERIVTHLEAAQKALLALDGGLLPEPARAAFEEGRRALEKELETFQNLAVERRQSFEKRLPVDVGRAIKMQYGEVFEDLLKQAGEVEASWLPRAAQSRSRFRWIFFSLLAGWILACGAFFGLLGRQSERRLEERLFEKSRDQLVASQKMEAVGRLARGLAHDISNYLAAIRGHSELVLMKPLAPQRLRQKMEAVLRTVEKATTLLDRLLTFSRHRSSEFEPVHLNGLLSELGKMLEPSLGEQYKLEFELFDELWWVETDPTQMEQVVVNLLMNARSAMPQGGTIRLRTENHPGRGEEEDMVCLTVSDRGCGIPEDVQDKIFEPFWTTRKGQGGSGLGLAVVYGVVHQSGGQIVVRSTLGEGASFEISLPRSNAGGLVTREEEEEEVELGGDATLMLVDDNEEFLVATAALLEGLGYQVVTATDAAKALELFRDLDRDIDLVLTDLVMPGMDGRELVERLRQEKADVRALFLSGHGEEVVRSYDLAPRDVHLPKGQLSAACLDGVLRRVLAGASSSVHLAGSSLAFGTRESLMEEQ